MANSRDIRQRIKSVKSTRQITKAMELVAISKMKRAQQAALNGRPYAEELITMIVDLLEQTEDFSHPFLETREIKTRGVLLVTTDKGLCGPLNTNLFKLVDEMKTPAKFVVVGNKGAQFIARTRRALHGQFHISDRVEFSETRPVAQTMSQLYIDGEIDTIDVIYPFFKNTLVQHPIDLPLLPIANLKKFVEKRAGETGVKLGRDKRPTCYEPSPSAILDLLLPFYINHEIHQTIVAAKASEHSARMVAMKTANDNAAELINDLTLQYNKARQTAITNEIIEIAAASAGQDN